MNPEFTLLEYGIYDLVKENYLIVPHADSSKDYFYEIVSEQKAVKVTDKIPLSLETVFGIRFFIGGKRSSSFPVSIKVLHPEIENPATNFSFQETVQQKMLLSDTNLLEIYKFDYKWEMVPGFWTFQVVYQSEVVLEKEFELYNPSTSTEEEEEVFFFDM